MDELQLVPSLSVHVLWVKNAWAGASIIRNSLFEPKGFFVKYKQANKEICLGNFVIAYLSYRQTS